MKKPAAAIRDANAALEVMALSHMCASFLFLFLVKQIALWPMLGTERLCCCFCKMLCGTCLEDFKRRN